MIFANQRDTIEGKSHIGKVDHEAEGNNERLFENDLEKLNWNEFSNVGTKYVNHSVTIACPCDQLNEQNYYAID